jgi:hypothetical protein
VYETSMNEKPESLLSTRRLTRAGLAAIVGSSLCCVAPLTSALGLSGATVATIARLFGPSTELMVGALALIGTLAVTPRLRSRSFARTRADGDRPSVDDVGGGGRASRGANAVPENAA